MKGKTLEGSVDYRSAINAAGASRWKGKGGKEAKQVALDVARWLKRQDVPGEVKARVVKVGRGDGTAAQLHQLMQAQILIETHREKTRQVLLQNVRNPKGWWQRPPLTREMHAAIERAVA